MSNYSSVNPNNTFGECFIEKILLNEGFGYIQGYVLSDYIEQDSNK